MGAPGSQSSNVDPIPAGAYTVTNDLEDRTFDANAATVAELCDVVATLIGDLAAAGIVTKS